MSNFVMSPHWSFYELTNTSKIVLLGDNRAEALNHVATGRDLANGILEKIRNGRPLYTGSGFRGEALNSTTKGSSSKSQHRFFQAADLARPREDCKKVFAEIIGIIEEQKIPFGQLIYEEVERDYGIARWIHVSLGPGYRDPKKCGQIMTRKNKVWKLIKKVDCSDWKLKL